MRAGPPAPAAEADPAQGGRPYTDDRACFAGIVYALRNAVRWNDMPAGFPSGVTCWRRHRDGTRVGVWEVVWRLVVGELAGAGELDTSELALDATFAEDRKGGRRTAVRAAASA